MIKQLAAGGVILLVSNASLAVVSGDLLTNSNATSDWQNCDGSSLIGDTTTTFDATHLEGEGCVYRETPIEAQVDYKLTCGVISSKYSSLTLAFLNDNGETLSTETTEIFEDTNGDSYSVVLSAPAGATTGAVGIYGLAGTGFQDCTLLVENPPEEPVDGSIWGRSFFDTNGDGTRQAGEPAIPATGVTLFADGVAIAEKQTNENGGYYFGGLDIGQCYTIEYVAADPTLTMASIEGVSVADAAATTNVYCPTEATPNIRPVHVGFVTIVPETPPQDYAVCGKVFLTADDTTSGVTDVRVVLVDTVSGERYVDNTAGANGRYAFTDLPASSYRVRFIKPSGHSFIEQSDALTGTTSYVVQNGNGFTPVFELPAAGNTPDDAACTIRNVNAGLVEDPITLERTIARNDSVTAEVGEAINIDFLANDAPCEAQVSEVDIIGHNVPGRVVYNEAMNKIFVRNTTETGTFSIEYGIRGACGSYNKAVITVELTEVPPVPPVDAPDAPLLCFQSVGKITAIDPNVHVDITMPQGGTYPESFATAYNFYDEDKNLLFTGFRDAGDPLSAYVNASGLHWKDSIHGIEVLLIATATALENGLESEHTECVTRLVTPIALDTDNSGQVETIVGDFDFDMDGDGIKETLAEWFNPADAILIYRDYGDAITGAHLFGDTGGKYADGFVKLATEDMNGDGQLNNAELDKLALWTDRNSNQMVDEGEISSLDSHSIVSLSVDHYKYTARAELENGRTMLMQDLWLSVRPLQQASK